MLIIVVFTAILVIMSPCDATKLRLYRMYRASTSNHFYTSSAAEASSASQQGYAYETSPGFVLNTGPNPVCSIYYSRTVYRLYRAGAKDDHFYTYNYDEAKIAANSGYRYEGPVFQCMDPNGASICGATIPLRRYLLGSEHFYTGDANEGNVVVAGGAKFEGILCYIWPTA